MNMVMPTDEFLSALRELCDKHGALLIFDEVMTGFALPAGGAQALFGVQPDINLSGQSYRRRFECCGLRRARQMSCASWRR